MSDANASRLGQINGSGDTKALFLKVYAGETLNSYNASTIMASRTRVKTTQNAKSIQFPALGKATAGYHSAGAEITTQSINTNERVIVIDDLIYSATFIDDLDAAMSQYDYRAEYSTQTGLALATVFDRNLLSLGVLAARNPSNAILGLSTITGGFNAESLTIGTANTPASVTQIRDSITSAAQKFDEKNVPKEGRYVAVPPAVYYQLLSDDKLLNQFFSPNSSSNYQKAFIPTIAGIEIVTTNNLSLNHVTATDAPDVSGGKYGVDATKTLALVFHKDALGTAKLKDVSSRIDYDFRRIGTQMLSTMAVGHAVLRPEGLIEIKQA